MTDGVGGRPPTGRPQGPEQDPDIWSEPAGSRLPPRRGPSAPPRRGAAGPPRRTRAARPPGTPKDPGEDVDHGGQARRPGGTDPDGPVRRSHPLSDAVRAGRPSGEVPDAAGETTIDDGYGYEYEDLPSEGRFPRWVAVLVVFAVLVGAVVGGAWWWYDRQINPPGSPGETVSVEVPPGASISGIGSILDREGVVPSALVFNFYASRKNVGPFEAGVYELRQNSDIDLVLDTMAKGPSATAKATETVRVSIPEGLTVAAVVARIADQVPRFKAEKLQAALDDGAVKTSLKPDRQKSYEGMLFPATYEVAGKTSEREFLIQLADEMQTRVSGLDPAAAKARVKQRFGLDLSTYELMTVASLVQAEAGNAQEAPKIATVIYNRLAEDSTALTLGIDASDAYGAKVEGVDLAAYQQTDGAYNTRKVKGLPPTPISAPGDFALEAAFDPAQGDWLYYVLTSPGTHTFAVTNAEFQAAKQICVQKKLGCG